MNSQTIDQSWENIVLLTASMEQAASSEDWSDVASRAAHRHDAIQQHFHQFSVGPETASFYHQHLSNFLQKEEKLQILANTARRETLRNSLTLINNKKAVKAYQNTGNNR